MEELRQRNLQLVVDKSTFKVREKALKVELAHIKCARDAFDQQAHRAESDVEAALQVSVEREHDYISSISKMATELVRVWSD